MRRLGEIPCPDIELRQADQRLAGYVDNPAEAELFKGNALLHTDWNNHNVLITHDTARLVDWGWATRGAAWLDPAHWIIWLIAAGHTPADAESQAAALPTWDTAPPPAVDAFARASNSLWTEIAGNEPGRWSGRMMSASTQWLRHRMSESGSRRQNA